MALPFLIAVIVLLTGYGYYRLKRAEEAARRYLAGGGEQPLQLAHRSEALARVAQDTRLLRIALESPLQAVRDALEIDLTRTEDDLEGLDAALLDATREIGLWLAMIDGLPANERQELDALGAGPEAVRGAMIAENWSFERVNLRPEGRPRLDVRLEAVIKELTRIESALQGQGRVYR